VGEDNGAERRTGVRYLDVAEGESGLRLDKFLTQRLPGLPRTRLFRIIRKGEVRVNGGRAGPQMRLAARDRVRVPPLRLEAPTAAEPAARGPSAAVLERVRRAIIHEDARLLVLDKPAGLAVHGGSGIDFGVIEALRALRPGETLELVHRLDRDTSGCLLVARTAAALRTAHAVLREGRSEKRYLALLCGRWDLGRKRIDAPLRTDTRVGGERTVRVGPGGKPSVSEFRLVQTYGRRGRAGPKASLLEVTLHTGRTHQIRVHAAYAGHPVAGDAKYGDAACNAALRELGLNRMFLHAHSMSFEWPDGATFSASAPLPEDLSAVLGRLER
jgi:23S rRNA pseudouridine955/2504/2580 synthase